MTHLRSILNPPVSPSDSTQHSQLSQSLPEGVDYALESHGQATLPLPPTQSALFGSYEASQERAEQADLALAQIEEDERDISHLLEEIRQQSNRQRESFQGVQPSNGAKMGPKEGIETPSSPLRPPALRRQSSSQAQLLETLLAIQVPSRPQPHPNPHHLLLLAQSYSGSVTSYTLILGSPLNPTPGSYECTFGAGKEDLGSI